MSIDSHPVQSSSDIETALGTSQTGTVEVMYFKGGVSQSFVKVKIR
jgi:hypothetical protein